MSKIRICLVLIPLLFSLITLNPVYAESDVERVIIVSVDSMNNNFIFNDYENPGYILTPNMGILLENGAAFTDAEAVMPTKTQVNHLTIVSGSYAEKIGVAGNYVLDPNKSSILFWKNYRYPWKSPELIKADTIFKALEREDSTYTSAVVAGKNFVGCPIWADIQVGPACISKSAEELGINKFPEVQLWDAPDDWVMDNVLLILEEADPEIMLINLAFLDPVQHAFSHGSMESWAALTWADYQIGNLIKYLKDSGKLDRTLIVVTADHGQSNAWQSLEIGKILRNEGVKSEVVADGPFAHIFLRDKGELDKAVDFLRGLEALDGVWYADSLDDIHIGTPYTGDIVISLKPPYDAYSRIKPPVIGTHGGLQQRFVPLIFFGPNVKRGVIMESASLIDIVPTIYEITGFPLPDDSQGEALPVFDPSLKTSPDIAYVLKSFKIYTLSYITQLFLVLSFLILIPALILQKQYGYLWLNVTSNTLSNIIPHSLITVSTIFAIVGSVYSYVLNLYVVPGIQPDSFLVSMDFGILGSFIVSVLVSLIIIWYVPLGLQVLLQRIRGKGRAITIVPLSLLIFTIIQLIYASINIMIRIPYNYSFHVFVVFFFGGLGLSYIYRGLIIKRHIEFERRKILTGTLISGAVNILFWFYLLMFLLFPNYLFDLGLGSIL